MTTLNETYAQSPQQKPIFIPKSNFLDFWSFTHITPIIAKSKVQSTPSAQSGSRGKIAKKTGP